MDLERGSVSSSSASSPLSAADRLELEAAEALAGLAYLATRETVADSATKWGRKGKRLKKRVKSESPPPQPPPPSDLVLNPADPVQAGSDPVEEDQTKVGKQQVEIKGSNVFIESVKAEQNSESLELSHCCVGRYKSTGGGRPRQNLTEAEKEARRLRRILANRESARQTIRRRQVLCAELTQKAADLAEENEHLKREKELALNEYQSLESTNKCLKAEMAKAIKADKGQFPGEVKSLHRKISGPPSTDRPFFFYNQHPFPPFGWPSMVQSCHQLQAQHGPQTAIVAPPNIPMAAFSKLNSSQDPGNYININGTKSPFYLVPCPWFIPHPDHGNGFHPQPSCHLNDIQDETSVSNQFSASSTKTSYGDNHNTSIDIKVEKEACGSIEEARPNDLNVTPVKFPLDGGSHCTVVHHTENIIVPTTPSSTGATFVVKQESLSDYISNVEASSIRASHSLNPSAVNNQEPVNYGSKKVLEAVAAAEARKRRRELTKLKNLHGKQCRMQC
ncbi:hypothetical protein SLA2020_479380 [Shorea laevis]